MKKALKQPFLIKDTKCSFPVFTLSDYNSTISQIVKIAKYRPSEKTVRILSNQCAKIIKRGKSIDKTDILVPVPMHKDRMNIRGFNQADLISQIFANKLECRHSPAIIRTRNTRAQADCSQEERLQNLENAFELHPSLDKNKFKNKSIIIIDDVVTTGTTIEKCAQTIRLLKPKTIKAIVISHSFKKSA